MVNVRKIAYTVLLRVLKDDAYSALTLNSEIKKNELDTRDSSFLSNIVYGVLERKLLLDDIISQYSNIPIKKIDIETRIVLYIGIYQLCFMDKVPNSAAVNESVKLAKNVKLFRSANFINAVLRNLVRNENKYKESSDLSIKYSVSEDIVDTFTNAYGKEMCEKILSSLYGRAPIIIRVNTVKTSKEELIQILQKENVRVNDNSILENTLSIEDTGSLEKLDSFKNGLFYVQDLASQICCEILDAKEGETICDICSAPGGKSIYSAIKMNNKGTIYSFDKYDSKVNLIKENAKRLGIDIINASVRDAEDKNLDLPLCEKVLLDVPCSGIGIMRRKPEIRYKKDTNIDLLSQLQYDILCINTNKIPTNCDVIYSTCSLNPKENREIVDKFLKSHKNFEPIEIKLPMGIKHCIDEESHMLTLFPGEYGSDGFFISKMRKVGSDD